MIMAFYVSFVMALILLLVIVDLPWAKMSKIFPILRSKKERQEEERIKRMRADNIKKARARTEYADNQNEVKKPKYNPDDFDFDLTNEEELLKRFKSAVAQTRQNETPLPFSSNQLRQKESVDEIIAKRISNMKEQPDVLERFKSALNKRREIY
jgi:hypothetical protein